MILLTKENIEELVRDGEASVDLVLAGGRSQRVRLMMENVSPFDCMLSACLGFRSSKEVQDKAREEAYAASTLEVDKGNFVPPDKTRRLKVGEQTKQGDVDRNGRPVVAGQEVGHSDMLYRKVRL